MWVCDGSFLVDVVDSTTLSSFQWTPTKCCAQTVSTRNYVIYMNGNRSEILGINQQQQFLQDVTSLLYGS